VMVAWPAAMHEGVLFHFGSNSQASSGSPGENPCAFPASQKPQAVLLVTCTATPVVGAGAAGDARQLASRFPPAATAEGGFASDDDAVAAEPASAQAITNTAAAGSARWSWVLVAIPSPKLRRTVEFTEVTPGCRHHSSLPRRGIAIVRRDRSGRNPSPTRPSRREPAVERRTYRLACLWLGSTIAMSFAAATRSSRPGILGARSRSRSATG
jgi:hypothetical protein